jgi:hypothetical protein
MCWKSNTYRIEAASDKPAGRRISGEICMWSVEDLKVEDPLAFETLEEVESYIKSRCCSLCLVKHKDIPYYLSLWPCMPDDFETLPIEERINMLLGTACGVEMYVYPEI